MGVYYKRYFRVFVSIAALFLLQQCGGLDDNDFIDSDQLAREQNIAILNFFADNNITGEEQVGDSPIYFVREISNTDGEETSSAVCGIYYTASVLDGEVFDSHLPEDGESILLRQGVNAILPVGLDLGIAQMKEGETFTFFIPSALGYGGFEFPQIPANSIIKILVSVDRVLNEVDRLNEEIALINDFVESNELNDLEQNPLSEVRILSSGERYKTIVAGSGSARPLQNQVVSLTYTGSFLDGDVFDATEGDAFFTYSFGNNQVIPGFDNGVGQMVLGERALVIIPSNSGYGASVRVIPAFAKEEFINNRIIPSFVQAIDPYEIIMFDMNLREIN